MLPVALSGTFTAILVLPRFQKRAIRWLSAERPVIIAISRQLRLYGWSER